MIDFVKHIELLLYLHDCVIVPGLGGFICNRKEATINQRKGTIDPPSKVVVFNKYLKQNDGLLIHWISEQEGIDYAKAQKMLTCFCEDVRVKLNRGESVQFENIGTFHMDRRFNLVFEPGKHNFLADSYGMAQLNLSYTPGNRDSSSQSIVSESNFINRLLKYGVSAAIIAGIVIIARLDLHDQPGANITTMQPFKKKERIAQENITFISPECDYIDFDPTLTLPF